jgi:hypothetical protein
LLRLRAPYSPAQTLSTGPDALRGAFGEHLVEGVNVMTKQLFIRVSRSYAMLVALVGVLIAASAGAAPTRATTSLVKPRTLYIEHGKIHKFAQDGDRISWIGGRHYDVHLRGVSKRRGWLLGHAGPNFRAATLVLGGTRAVWVQYEGVLSRAAYITTAKPGLKPKVIDGLSATYFYDGLPGRHLTDLAASGQTILYAEAQVTCWGDIGECELTGGGVRRVQRLDGHRAPHLIPGVPPALAIATSGRRIAVLPAVLADPHGADLTAAPNGPVNVYNLTGHQLAQVVPEGTVTEVALSWPDLGVIVERSDGTTVIERYDAAHERLIAATSTPDTTRDATDLSIGTGAIVFREGNTIYRWWDTGSSPSVLWRSHGKPVGLSIEGRRVAWAANGRIRALNLPRG